LWVLALSAAFAVARVVGACWPQLALVATRAHMLSVSARWRSRWALWLPAGPGPQDELRVAARRRSSRTGERRGPGPSVGVVVEAVRDSMTRPRCRVPPVVIGASASSSNRRRGILWRAGGHSLNVRAALLHVLADLAGSVGVIVAAVVILSTGWMPIDPILGVMIGLLVLGGSWRVLRESAAVLLEATPEGVDGDAVGRRLAGVDGVIEVHDLHIWTITSGFPALAAHVTVEEGRDCAELRRRLAALLAQEFGIAHTTLQVEPQTPGRRLHPVSTYLSI